MGIGRRSVAAAVLGLAVALAGCLGPPDAGEQRVFVQNNTFDRLVIRIGEGPSAETWRFDAGEIRTLRVGRDLRPEPITVLDSRTCEILYQAVMPTFSALVKLSRLDSAYETQGLADLDVDPEPSAPDFDGCTDR